MPTMTMLLLMMAVSDTDDGDGFDGDDFERVSYGAENGAPVYSTYLEFIAKMIHFWNTMFLC